jgi:glutamine synthetase
MDLYSVAKEKGIKYFLISFVDMFGSLRAKLVPATAISAMQKEGAGFAGFATWMDMTPANSDTLAIPDPESLIQLPWKPELGWLAADLWMDGKPVESCPRVILKRQIEKFKNNGIVAKSGVECEFFLLDNSGEKLYDTQDTQEKPCYDQQALMRRYDVISEICDCMLKLGWNPYQNDHEDANGQFEMNWDFTDVLTTADRHTFFKYMTKSIAEKHGLRATFMPKPFTHLTGNGCHAHISLWDIKSNKNMFADANDSRGLQLSELAYQFLGGILHNAQGLCALFNPTVNSYKRINTVSTSSGASWSPSTVTYSGNNRTHLVRVPAPGRFELRLMDGAANPYLMQAGILAGGQYGIDEKINPGDPLHINMYTEPYEAKEHEKLPKNLLDAIRILEKNNVLRENLGSEFIDSFSKMKYEEWNKYCQSMSDWERLNVIDC